MYGAVYRSSESIVWDKTALYTKLRSEVFVD
jgi:hypothetical protein